MNRLFKLTALLCSTLATGNALGDTISISHMDAHDIKSKYFALDQAQKVEIEFLAPKHVQEHDEDADHDFVWIIDLDSREMVWRSRRSDEIEDARNARLKVYGDKVTLDEGRYGLFYSTHNFRISSNNNGVDLFLYGLSSLLQDKHQLSREDIEAFYVDLRGTGIEKLNKDEQINPFGHLKPIIALTKVRNNRFEQFGLEIAKDTDLAIYAVGELASRRRADSAWLTEAASGDTVWQMDLGSTESAGGADKNRRFKDTIKLKQGDYILSFASDSSHHYNDWNSQPPFDPAAWGVSVYADKAAKITLYDPVKRRQQLQILAITDVGDNANLSQHFSISEPTAIRVIAMGERQSKKRMADHGWIVNSKTNQKVWQMRPRKTKHAGGSDKNRISDEVISLVPGSYTVHYVSDSSHSYADGWNASSPQNQKQWGISLYGSDKDFDKQAVKLLDAPVTNALAHIQGVKNDAKSTATFELAQSQAVRIYAIGEGGTDEMTDYGYIKSLDTGKRVWMMYADETKHAGGARKNRMANDVIELKKGKYQVYFHTDGSHSLNNWNATPPDDAMNYGISVYDASESVE